MRVFMTGGTGLLGSRVLERLAGHQVIALSRRTRPDGAGVTWVQGDAAQPGPWQEHLAAADAAIHLAGEPIDRRWTRARKKLLRESRVTSTEHIVDAIGRGKILICASGAGYYGPRGEDPLDESAPAGSGFLADLCRAWEAAALAARSKGVRVVPLRLGVVLSGNGGALRRLLPPFRLYLGGPLGPPGRWFPWIHEDDAAGLVMHALVAHVPGPMNAVAPGAVRMREFARELGRALHRPSWLPVPELALRLALGEFGAWISPGQKVLPRAALDSGYHFAHETLSGALSSVLSRSRAIIK